MYKNRDNFHKKEFDTTDKIELRNWGKERHWERYK